MISTVVSRGPLNNRGYISAWHEGGFGVINGKCLKKASTIEKKILLKRAERSMTP